MPIPHKRCTRKRAQVGPHLFHHLPLKCTAMSINAMHNPAKHSDRIGAKPKAPKSFQFILINPNGLRPIRSLLLCIPLHSSASRTSVAFHRAPRTSRALLSCLSWCVHSSVPGTGASADLRSRSPFPPDVTFGPAPSLRVRILLQLHLPISS